MKIKKIVDTVFQDYKKISMFIGTAYCDFKCDKINGCAVCQNSALVNSPTIDIPINNIVRRYLSNPVVSALVIGGLEPLDQMQELEELIKEFRKHTDDDIVIYTGYPKNNCKKQIKTLKKYKNIIVKFGYYLLNRPKRFDDILGVELASDNQYAERIS